MQVNFVEANPVPVKAAMAAMGLLEEVYRLPMCSPRPESKEKILRVLKELELLEAGVRAIAMLETDIQQLVAAGAAADRDAVRAAFAELRAALSAGTVRAAEPDASSPVGWRVNTWVKQGILLGFKFGDIVDVSMDHGKLPFYDKDTLPLKKPGLAAGVRIVPGGSAVRDGAYHRARRDLHAADVHQHRRVRRRRQSLIDSHALVGSCAQVGARVHISAGGADRRRDRAGRRAAGDHRRRRAGWRQHRNLRRRDHQSTRGDCRRNRAYRIDAGLRPRARRNHQADRRAAAGDPRRRRRGARCARGDGRQGTEWGLSLATPVIVKYRDSRTDTRTELEAWIR